MSEELQPCPFCGGKADLDRYFDEACWHDVYVVGCIRCGVSFIPKDTPKEAIEVWNTRAERTAKATYKALATNEQLGMELISLRCGECGYEFGRDTNVRDRKTREWHLSQSTIFPNYCTVCGAKVVE